SLKSVPRSRTSPWCSRLSIDGITYTPSHTSSYRSAPMRFLSSISSSARSMSFTHTCGIPFLLGVHRQQIVQGEPITLLYPALEVEATPLDLQATGEHAHVPRVLPYRSMCSRGQ